MNKWMTIIALLLGIGGIVLLAHEAGPGLGCLTLILGAVVFMTGNRIARQRIVDKHHKDLVDTLKKQN